MGLLMENKPNKVIKFIFKNENSVIMKNFRPDLIVVEEFKEHLVYALFVVEIQLKENDNDHIIQTLKYNEEILLANPRRQFIISILTTLEKTMLMKSSRVGDIIIHERSTKFDFWDQGLNYIYDMLANPSKAGYDANLNFTVEIDEQIHDIQLK